MTASSIIRRKGVVGSTKRATETVDTSGFPVRTYTTNLTGIYIFAQDSSGSAAARGLNESIRNMAERNIRTGTAYVEADVDVLETDQLIVGSRTLEVVHVHARDTTGALSHKVVDYEERL